MKTTIQQLMESLPEPVVNHIQHLERMRQDFVANVSHELRTPLTVIHGYLETLLEQNNESTKPLHKIFLQMQQQTSRMENLIEDLLLLAHLESDQQEQQEQTKVAVAELLSHVYHEARQLSGDLQHRIELHADRGLLLYGAENELRSLFSNIVFNAVKYTPANGRIEIHWYHQQQQAYFKVTDTGIGIAPQHIPRLTERFYRVDKARSRASGGTGLGLAIAKHVLIRHEGKLEIASKVSQGSTFTCAFPASRFQRLTQAATNVQR